MNKRNLLFILLTLLISCILITGCGNNSEPDEDLPPEPIYDINDFAGFYSSAYVDSVEISVGDGNTMTASVMLSESLKNGSHKVTEWSMSGYFDDVTGYFSYDDAVKTEKTVSDTWVDEDSTVLSETELYSDGSGKFCFLKTDEIIFSWEDDKETEFADDIFEKDISEDLSSEDLTGTWGKPGGIPLVIVINEDGTIGAYTGDDETSPEPMGPDDPMKLVKFADGSWSADGKEVCITIGNSEHRFHGDSGTLYERDNPNYSLHLNRTDKKFSFDE